MCPVIMSLTYPHRKKSSGVLSGESGGHGIRPKYAHYFLFNSRHLIMTSYFLPDINAASTALPNKHF
jgi:hypothetical protein